MPAAGARLRDSRQDATFVGSFISPYVRSLRANVGREMPSSRAATLMKYRSGSTAAAELDLFTFVAMVAKLAPIRI